MTVGEGGDSEASSKDAVGVVVGDDRLRRSDTGLAQYLPNRVGTGKRSRIAAVGVAVSVEGDVYCPGKMADRLVLPRFTHVNDVN